MHHCKAYGMAGNPGHVGAAWAQRSTSIDAFKRFETLPRIPAICDQVPVFVTWNRGRWHLLRALEYVDTAAEARARQEEFEKRRANHEQSKKKRGEGKDWRGDKRKKPAAGGSNSNTNENPPGASQNTGGYNAYSGGWFGDCGGVVSLMGCWVWGVFGAAGV